MRDFELVKQELIELAKKYHVKKMWIYGSRANGKAGPKSDIDLCVDGCDDFRHFYLECTQDVNTLLDMDVILYGSASVYMQNFVKNQGVIIYEV